MLFPSEEKKANVDVGAHVHLPITLIISYKAKGSYMIFELVL